MNWVRCSQGKALVVIVPQNIDGTMIQGDQDSRQMPVEEVAIEVVERLRQTAIFAPGRLVYRVVSYDTLPLWRRIVGFFSPSLWFHLLGDTSSVGRRGQ